MANNADDISKTFCIMPWVGVATDVTGGLHPCCWMELNKEDVYTEDFAEYKKSEYLNKYKKDFLNGAWPDACARCKINEERGNGSKRIRENFQYNKKNGDWNNLPEEFSVIDIRLSNVCNLGCISCSPKSSSYIKQEVEKHGLDKFPKKTQVHYHEFATRNLINPYTDKNVSDLTDMIDKDARIYITGGEPSLVKKAKDLLLTLRDKGLNESVHLEFNSNFQALNQTWIDILKYFKGEMWPSLDGVSDVAEYARYPSSWKRVDTNLQVFKNQCQNWRIRIMPTISILSIFGLKDLYDYTYNTLATPEEVKNGRVRLTPNNRLYEPKWLDIRNLPKQLKDIANFHLDYIEKHYIKYEKDLKVSFNYLEEVRKQLHYDAELEFNETIINLEKWDSVRNNSWKTALPIIYKYVKENE